MMFLRVRGVRAATFVAVVAVMACRGAVDEDAAAPVARLVPASVSRDDAWKLFDRSLTSEFVPDDAPLRISLRPRDRLAAIKVRGGSPYVFAVRGHAGEPLGFMPVDLSKLNAGWHVLTPTDTLSTHSLELSFTRIGDAPGGVPEVELWGALGDDDDAVATAKESAQSIAAGDCATFHVPVTRPPAAFRRAYLVYSATHALRAFALESAINGAPSVGGAWMEGAAASHELRDEVDPEQLTLGDNTVRLCLPKSATTTVEISNLRLIGDIDSGTHSVTQVEEQSSGRVVLHLDRLLAPDSIVTDAGSSISELKCIGAGGDAVPAAFEDRGDRLQVEGADRACASLSFALKPGTALGSIDVVGSTAGERVDCPRIVITSRLEHFGDVAYVAGFVARPQTMTGATRVNVGSAAVESMSGSFGQLVHRTGNASGAWSVDVTARLPDGSSAKKVVELIDDRKADILAVASDHLSAQLDRADDARVDEARFGTLGEVVRAKANLMTETVVKVGTDAGVVVPPGAVLKPTLITAERLDSPMLPPLDPGMVNVTAPEGQGYEFLPHGQQFARDVEVAVPFDSKLLPDGMTENDVNTYFYDETSHRWRKLQRTQVDVGRRIVKSASSHFTIMINAVLAVPTNPSALSFDPTALSAIAAASPAAGVDLIEPPNVSPTGDARLSLPIRVPAGRGAYTPSMSITYSSAADNGWLGLGWNLDFSKIEIDTRWGVPRYTPNEEVRYLLDGSELVPTLEVEGPTCPDNSPARRYHTRVEGNYLHIVRCGSSPSTYYWMVHDRAGTRFLYGRDSNGNAGGARLASYRGSGGVFRWHLREVKDVNENTTTLSYSQDDVSGTEPAREVYPQRIDYTSHPAKPAAYSIELVLDDGTRGDRLVNARSGFKMVTRRLLRAVRVRFLSTTIREYVLTYKEGQFGKTLLASVRVYGLGGCAASANAFAPPTCAGEFHQHTFDYHVDAKGFGAVTPVCAELNGPNCSPTVVTNTLTKSKTKSLAGTLSGGVESDDGQSSAGVSVSGSFGDRVENVGMYDIDGDGDVDQVYQTSNGLQAFINTGSGFALSPSSIQGVTALARDGNTSWSIDASAAVSGASASAGYAHSTARAKKLFTDIDGDGYIDYLNPRGTSKRSEPCPSGICFTDVDYGATTMIDPTKDPDLVEAATDVNAHATPASPALQWVAPYTGTIKVHSLIGLVRPGTVDGVSIGLFHDDTLLLGKTITDATGTAYLGESVNVRAGDAIYLYISTGAHDGGAGLVDEVAFAPLAPLVVEYTSACTDATCGKLVDKLGGNEPTGAAVFSFASSQLRVVAAQPLRAAYKGTLVISGNVVKTKSSAPLRYCLQRFNADAETTDYQCGDQTMPGTTVSSTYSVPQDEVSTVLRKWYVDVKPGDQVVLRVEADFSFDPDSISFDEAGGSPRVAYVSACIPDDNGVCTVTSGAEAEDLPVADQAFGFFAAPVSRPEPAGAPPLVYVANGRCEARLKPFPNPLGSGMPVAVFLRTDRRGTLTTPAPFACTTTCTPPSTAISLTDGESLSIEVVAPSIPLPLFRTVELSCNGGSYEEAPLIFRRVKADSANSNTPFVGGYHGWNTTFWNEHEPFAPASLLAQYPDLSALPGCAAPPTPSPDPALCKEQLDRVFATAVKPNAAFNGSALTNGIRAWVAPQSGAFVLPSTGHFNAGTIGGAGATTPGGTTPGASEGGLFDPSYARLSTTGSYFFGINAASLPIVDGLSIPGFQATVTKSTTKTTTDVFDLTGDGIPDVISGGAAYQGSIGASPTPKLPFQFKRIRTRTGTQYMIGAGVGAAVTVTTSGGRPRVVLSQKADTHAKFTLGTSRGLAIARSQTTDDIMDVNGDGLPDVVQRRGADINVRYNLGDDLGAWETIGHVDPALAGQIDTFESLEQLPTVFGDLNTTANALAHETTITQNETFSIGIFVASGSRTTRKTSTRTTRQLADLNGDGLPDLLVKRSGQPIQVQYNRGSDFGPPETWDSPSWGALELSPAFNVAFNTVTVSGPHIVTGPDVLAATGTDVSKTYSGSFHWHVPGTYAFLAGAASKSTDEDTFELALMDINGDGRPDHVLRRKQSGQPRIYVKPNRVTLTSNLLERVTRPMGGWISLGYTAKASSQDMPHPRAVLASVEVDDGITLGAEFASPNVMTTFDYEGGYFHRLEKQFLGFARVTTKRADGGTLEQYFNNHDFTMQGLVTKTIHRDSASNVLSERRLTYEIKPVQGPAGAIAADPSCVSALHVLLARLPNNDACTPRAPVVVRDDDIQGELGTAAMKVHTVRDTSWDRFGNVLSTIDDGDDAVSNDNVVTTAAYSNDTSRWILGRPTLLDVRPNGALSALRSRSGLYDTRGRLTQVSVDTGNGVATTTIGYDAYGNVTHIETPPNATGQTQTFDVTFDPTVATYPVSTIDGFGYASSAVYDLRYGLPTTETDVNGAQIVRGYDGFGRLTSVRGPYDNGAAGITLEYHPTENPPRALGVTRASAPSDYNGPLPEPITTVTLGDGLGRAIEIRKTAVVDGVTGMTTSGLVQLDSLGRVTKSWHPFFTPGPSTSFISPVASYATTTTYDELDRSTSVTHADGALETTTYAIATAPNGQLLFRTQHTVVVPGLNRVRESYADQLGHMRVYVEHPSAGASSITKYDYLPTGELGSIVDAEGNVTFLGYDLRGLRTTLSNPDTGLVQDVFDLMGNRIATIEPNHRALNTQVSFKYDRNRLTTIDYPSKPDVTYLYGAPGATNNAAGRLTRVTDESGSIDYSYGALGETRRVLRTFAPAGTTQPLNFEQRFTYESLGRQLQLRYPDGEVVTNTFDAGGLLTEVRGAGDGWQRTYATGMRYDVFGNRTRMEVGRVVSTWSYDPARVRLKNVVSTLQPPGGAATQIQNLAYTYDAVGNPTSITNELATPLASATTAPRRSSVSLSYDGVDRLIFANGDGQQDRFRTTDYFETFSYSPSHNLVAKSREHEIVRGMLVVKPPDTNLSLSYNYSTRPHLPDQVGSLQLLYDPSGNPTRRFDTTTGLTQQLTWDDDGRLVQLTDTSGVVQSNLYDATGLRVRRKSTTASGTRTTIFASQYFDLEGEQATNNGGVKHIFAGDQRIASVLGSFTSSDSPASPTTPGVAYFIHGDQLGSTTVVTDDLGAVNQSVEYFVDGAAWIDRSPSTPVNGYLFNGKAFDPETKFYDYGQRFYDPKTSLWLGVDPAFSDSSDKSVGRPLMLSVAAFAGHNPMSHIDLDGRDWTDGINIDFKTGKVGNPIKMHPLGSFVLHFAARFNPYTATASMLLDALSDDEPINIENLQSRDQSVRDQELAKLLDRTDRLRDAMTFSGGTASTNANVSGPGVNVKFANKYVEDTPSPNAPARARLVQQNGKWVTISSSGAVRSATGRYVFVTEGENIYVARASRAKHLDVSGGRVVDYAGEIRFGGRAKRGELREWSNNSGHYKPDASLAAQARLPLSKFVPVGD